MSWRNYWIDLSVVPRKKSWHDFPNRICNPTSQNHITVTFATFRDVNDHFHCSASCYHAVYWFWTWSWGVHNVNVCLSCVRSRDYWSITSGYVKLLKTEQSIKCFCIQKKNYIHFLPMSIYHASVSTVEFSEILPIIGRSTHSHGFVLWTSLAVNRSIDIMHAMVE